MNHLDTIVEIKNVVPPHFINKVIPLINYKSKKNLTVRGGMNKNIRNVKGYSLDFATPTNLFYWNFIKNEIQRLYSFYISKFPKLQTDRISQIDLLKYNSGGKYEVHTDHYSHTTRHLSIIINLNDNYEGGDLIFTDQKEKEIKRLKLNKGSIVFFPSNFMYPHSIQPITKGTRYSIVAWLQ
tara:strand:+ start:701 stop:1246 length:546 start_codon:yes stop_codon:yes gene_type:complete